MIGKSVLVVVTRDQPVTKQRRSMNTILGVAGVWLTAIVAVVVFVRGATIKQSPKPDVVSKRAKITDYYTKVGNCYYWKGTKFVVKKTNKCGE